MYLLAVKNTKSQMVKPLQITACNINIKQGYPNIETIGYLVSISEWHKPVFDKGLFVASYFKIRYVQPSRTFEE